MSNTARIAATAANTLTKPLNVEDVFSTYLYTGNGTSQTITNGIDLSGEGGLMWFKRRDTIYSHHLYDTEVGVSSVRSSDLTNADATGRSDVTVNSDGFSVGSTNVVNYNGSDFASWTFRKAPKFFDVVTYTGTGSAQNISHNLGSVPGFIIVKSTTNTYAWFCYHRSLGATQGMRLDDTQAASTSSGYWNNTSPTSTEFTVGTSLAFNASGASYVAYLFAHNDGDGDFGDGTQDIIKCGSYTGNYNSGSEPNIDLGFEPQWILFKNTTTASNWFIYDTMRGWSETSPDYSLAPDSSAAENGASGSAQAGKPTATGFDLEGCGLTAVNSLGDTHIYIAIRRGPMAVPTAGTNVFHVNEFTTTGFTEYTGVGFAPDLAVQKAVSSADSWEVVDKLRGPHLRLKFNETVAESAADTQYLLGGFLNDGVKMGTATNGQFNGWNPNLHYYWQRRPNYFDVVAYTGNDTAGHTISHNLGVAPEMIWVKSRSSALSWFCYHSALTSNGAILLNSNGASFTGTTYWNDTDPTASDFTLGTSINVNGSAKTYIAYLFASLDGVSKVGSFTYTQGVAQNIDCGFSSGARFVLYKRTSGTSGWTVFDTERGIVAGNDPMLFLNSTSAEDSNYDFIDPYSGGFALSDSTANLSGDYIFYAIA